jgi:hypothetical protein
MDEKSRIVQLVHDTGALLALDHMVDSFRYHLAWPWQHDSYEKLLQRRTKFEHVASEPRDLQHEDDLLKAWTYFTEFRKEHEALGHTVSLYHSDENGYLCMHADWERPATEEELKAAQDWLDTNPKKDQGTLKWLRPIPFEVSTKENND